MPSPNALLVTLFRYTGWANGALIETLRHTPLPADVTAEVHSLLSHLLRAQTVWLGRIEHSAAAHEPFWHTDPLDACADRAAAATTAWLAHLADHADQLDAAIGYTNSKGLSFTSTRAEIALHVTQHATHHRGQILQRLRQAGHTPPLLDFIHYARSIAPKG